MKQLCSLVTVEKRVKMYVQVNPYIVALSLLHKFLRHFSLRLKNAHCCASTKDILRIAEVVKDKREIGITRVLTPVQ